MAYLVGSPITALIIGKSFVWWKGLTFAAVTVFFSRYEIRLTDGVYKIGHYDCVISLPACRKATYELETTIACIHAKSLGWQEPLSVEYVISKDRQEDFLCNEDILALNSTAVHSNSGNDIAQRNLLDRISLGKIDSVLGSSLHLHFLMRESPSSNPSTTSASVTTCFGTQPSLLACTVFTYMFDDHALWLVNNIRKSLHAPRVNVHCHRTCLVKGYANGFRV